MQGHGNLSALLQRLSKQGPARDLSRAPVPRYPGPHPTGDNALDFGIFNVMQRRSRTKPSLRVLKEAIEKALGRPLAEVNRVPRRSAAAE